MSNNNERLAPIKPLQFYSQQVQKRVEEIENFSYTQKWTKEEKTMPKRLMGPTQFRSEFFKQANSIDIYYKNNTNDNPLSIFVQQDDCGYRKFIVSHPEIYWWSFMNKLTPAQRCTYELIIEGEPCCLYLDLEYEKELNPNSNGIEMTKTIMEIICGYYYKFFGIRCTEKNIINLDSTTDKKFSRHLIFRIKNIAFKDNSHVGRLLKNIVSDIEFYLATNGASFHDVLSYIERKDLENLFIKTDKKTKLFIDTTVYSKNRHFRIYKATKWTKNSYLERSNECTYTLIDQSNKDKELCYFLESLISYHPDKKNLSIIEFNHGYSDSLTQQTQQPTQQSTQRSQANTQTTSSKYPVIDKYIGLINAPGVIRQSKYFDSTNCIVYDIAGNRYCSNIGRQHKSNGIYWVVDLNKKCAYQKCHDVDDCFNYRSPSIKLPAEVAFVIEDDDDNLFSTIDDDDGDDTRNDQSSVSINFNQSI